MKKIIQILVVAFAVTFVALACEPVEIDEDIEMEQDF